jgi:hypothetical protein
MKKIILIATILFAGLVSTQTMQAQVRVGVNINIGSQPVWGPVGYDYVDYYYLPDIGVYYYVPRHQFIYLSGGRWIFSASLPGRYRDYDIYSGYKVVINEPRPYLRDNVFRERYSPYRGRRDQVIIRDSRDERYHHDNGNHNGWYKHDGDNGHGNGRGHGHHGRD